MARCMDCPSEATVQVVSPEGVPIGAFCDVDWADHQRTHERLMAMLREACASLTGA